MGIIIAKLRRKKTTEEVLEKLDKEIKTIEEYRKNTEQAHKRTVGRFIVISVGIYLLTAFLFYFYFFPATFYDRLFYIIPLIFAPVIILTVKRVLTWYYKWKISRKQNKLGTLREEKKKMLEKVMETETYKVAKSILEKYSEPAIRKSTALITSSESTPQIKQLQSPLPSSVTATGGLRQRALPAPNQQMVTSTPSRPIMQVSASSTVMRCEFGRTPMLPAAPFASATPGITRPQLPMPRAILPRERSVLDKMVDYLVGDGPQNRFALICRNCASHNGMAFREEYEYIAFHCCYCFAFNPARKKRPAAPKLEFDVKSPLAQVVGSDTSESEKTSPSDTDSESDTLLKTADIQDVTNKLEETASVNTIEHIEQDKRIPVGMSSLENTKQAKEQVDKCNDVQGELDEETKYEDKMEEKYESDVGVGIVKD